VREEIEEELPSSGCDERLQRLLPVGADHHVVDVVGDVGRVGERSPHERELVHRGAGLA
jgi:hypothetical protein